MYRQMSSTSLAIALVLTLSTASLARGQEQLSVGAKDDTQGTDVLGAFTDSLKLLMIEHGIRIGFQEKTRQELGGPFWKDYSRSVRLPPQWEDTDSWGVNYIGHPIHGAASGYIWLDHDPAAPKQITFDNRYWASRARATAWALSYSIQFEIGPLSEASIGNVGMRPETTGWVDHVVTPIGAFGFMIAEDAVDHYFVKWAEEHVPNPLFRVMIRLAANPSRTLSNTASGKYPWHRPDRPLRGR